MPQWYDRLNRRQRIALWFGVGVVLVMGLIPPWVKTFNAGSGKSSRNPAGYSFIAAPPESNGSGYWGVEIDTTRLLLQAVIVAAVTAGAIVALRGRARQEGKTADLSCTQQPGETVAVNHPSVGNGMSKKKVLLIVLVFATGSAALSVLSVLHFTRDRTGLSDGAILTPEQELQRRRIANAIPARFIAGAEAPPATAPAWSKAPLAAPEWTPPEARKSMTWEEATAPPRDAFSQFEKAPVTPAGSGMFDEFKVPKSQWGANDPLYVPVVTGSASIINESLVGSIYNGDADDYSGLIVEITVASKDAKSLNSAEAAKKTVRRLYEIVPQYPATDFVHLSSCRFSCELGLTVGADQQVTWRVVGCKHGGGTVFIKR